MLPHTHFLVAFFIGLLLKASGYLTLTEAFVIGILSTLVDLDHLFTYHKRHKKWSIKGTWDAAIVKHEQEKSFIQHINGFILTTFLLIIIYFIDVKLAVILGIAYYIHYLLDHAHIKIIQDHKIKRIFGIPYPFNYYELLLALICLIFILGFLCPQCL